jgi:hypothetical protein
MTNEEKLIAELDDAKNTINVLEARLNSVKEESELKSKLIEERLSHTDITVDDIIEWYTEFSALKYRIALIDKCSKN